MATQNVPQQPQERRPSKVKDLPGCIKYILLLFLVLLLLAEIYSGEFRRFPDWGWLTWVILLIKLLLIAILIWLIRVQRDLKCQITDPKGCASPEYDPALHKWIIRVKGTASGAVFGSYTLTVQRGGFPFPMPVIYPGGGSVGSAQVVNGELGKLDVTDIEPDSFMVILTVNPAGAGSAVTCTSTFDIQHRIVYIDRIGEVPARVMGPHPADPGEVLKLVKVNPDPPSPALPGPEASLAEAISVIGGADVYGCGRQMSEYVLQYREVASPNDPWQQDEPGAWSNINAPLPFGDSTHPRTYSSLFGTQYNYIRNGKLTRFWVLRSILQALPNFYDDKWTTRELPWNTSALNGRFTVRVRLRHQPIIGPPDPTPPELYDAATVWLDNRQIDGRITSMGIAGGGALGVCDELLLSQFVSPANTKINATVNGRAWDPLILDSYPNTLKPNDNFDYYRLKFKKDGGSPSPPVPPDWADIITSATRVPNILQQSPLPPLPAGTGTLALWDIVGALDAGPLPGGTPPDVYPQIYRGQRCAYLIELYVQDTTHRGDSSTPHFTYDYWPFCIMNDLSNNLVFPVPA